MDAFPRIIPRDFGPRTMQHMRNNLISLSKRRGLDNSVIGADGSPCTGKDLFEDKIRLVRESVGPDSPYYINDEMLRWVRLRASRPKHYTSDSGGFVSAENFYRGEPGPLAAYQRIRVMQLVHHGFTPEEALADMQADVARAHSRYLDRILYERDLGFLAAA